MALLINAQMTVSGAPGVSAFNLNAATPGAQTWAAGGALDSTTYSYRAEGAAGWEIGLGLYSATAKALVRSLVLASSNNNGAVNFGADVIVSQVALPGDIPPSSGFLNRLTNGGFSIWQRGASAIDSAFGPDGWRTSFSQGSARSGDVPPGIGCLYSCEFTGVSGASGPALYQNLPAADTLDLAGQVVTVGLWARSISGSASLLVSLKYASGSSVDDFSTLTNIATVAVAATAAGNWTFYSAQFVVPADATKGLQLVIGRGAGAGVTTRLAGAMLQCGNVATAYERRDALDLALCQRRFRRIAAGAPYKKFALGMANSSTAGFFLIEFDEMRGAPAFSTSGNFAVVGAGGNASVVTGFSTDQIDSTSVAFYAVVGSGLNQGQAVMLQSQGDTAARIDLSCEP